MTSYIWKFWDANSTMGGQSVSSVNAVTGKTLERSLAFYAEYK